MDLQLEGRGAIVTGASRGLGRAIAWELAREGAAVALVARGREPLEATAAEIRDATGARVVAVPADTGDQASVRDMVAAVHEALGRVDILVNNAAVPGGAPEPELADIADDHLWPDLNVKVMGYLRCAQAVAPLMRKVGWGRIVNIGGLGARNSGSIVNSIRNVSVAALTKNLADQLGPAGINVTVVHPGPVRTEGVQARFAARADAEGVAPAEIEQRIGASNSIRHFLDAEEVAWVVAFLSSPRSIAINGDAIAAGGGFGRAISY